MTNAMAKSMSVRLDAAMRLMAFLMSATVWYLLSASSCVAFAIALRYWYGGPAIEKMKSMNLPAAYTSLRSSGVCPASTSGAT